MDTNQIPEHLITAVDHFIMGKATAAEEAAVTTWYYSQLPGEVVLPVDRDFTVKQEHATMKLRMLAKMKEQGLTHEKRALMTRRMPVWRLMQAAAIFALLATGAALFLLNRKGKKETAAAGNTIHTNEVLPGTKRATLTLADGKVIMLDNQAKGLLAQEGSAAINVLDKGQLQYAQTNSLLDNPGVAPMMNTIAIPRGGEYMIILPDGTKVWMNAASSLRFPSLFYGTKREVALTGEAYFEVAKNVQMPFHVKANNLDVEVLGTSFNINAYIEEQATQTTLIAGKVKIKAMQPGTTANAAAAKILQPGEQGSLSRQGAMMVKEVNTRSVIAWKDGYFQFMQSSLPEVMAQISRWYDVQVVYEGGVVPTVAMQGRYPRASTLSESLKMLREVGGIHYTIADRKITISQ